MPETKDQHINDALSQRLSAAVTPFLPAILKALVDEAIKVGVLPNDNSEAEYTMLIAAAADELGIKFTLAGRLSHPRLRPTLGLVDDEVFR